MKLGKFKEAKSSFIKYISESQKEKKEIFPTNLYNLGETYFFMGEIGNSKFYYGKAMEIVEMNFGKEHPDYIEYSKRLEFVLTCKGIIWVFYYINIYLYRGRWNKGWTVIYTKYLRYIRSI